MWRKRWRFWFAAILALAATGLVTPLVLAHAGLVRSEPADGSVLAQAPRELRLWFDEPISTDFSSVRLLDSNNRPVELGAVRADPADPNLLVVALPDLAEGVYSVLWQVLSESDGHFSRGIIVLGVGEGADLSAGVEAGPESAPPPAEVALRWLNFSALATLVGAVSVVYLILVPAARSTAVARSTALALHGAQGRILGWARWGSLLALAVGLGLLGWQAATLLESLPERASLWDAAWQVLGRTRWGRLWLVRQTLLLALGASLFGLRAALARPKSPGRRPPPEVDRGRRPAVAITGLLLLALLAVQALTGHASAAGPHSALAVVADTLHLLAASWWAGGLLALAIGLAPWLQQQDRAGFRALVTAGWGPFSRLAALSVGLLMTTGLYSAGRQVASIDALITSLYGQALLGKTGLMLGAGALGLLNSMLLHPRVAAPLARLLGRRPGWTPLSLRRLPALVLAEAGLGLLVLLATGLITASPPPRGLRFRPAADVPAALTQTVDDVLVTLSTKPNRPGQNVFTVFATSTRRPAPAEIMRVIVRFTYLGEDLGTVSAVADEIEPGRYMLGGSYLSLAGDWRIDVVVRRRGIEDSVAHFDWTVVPAGSSRPVLVSDRPLAPLLTLAAAVGLLAILAVVAASLAAGRVSALRNEAAAGTGLEHHGPDYDRGGHEQAGWPATNGAEIRTVAPANGTVLDRHHDWFP